MFPCPVSYTHLDVYKRQVYLHLHMAAGDKDGHVFGGHLSMAYVSATAEIQIQISDGVIDRKYDKKIGLNLFDFTI